MAKLGGAAVGSLETLLRYRRMGAQILPWGADFALRQVLANCSAELDSSFGE